MPDQLSRTSLTPHAATMRDPCPEQARRAARQAYVQSGGKHVVINREWLSSWGDRDLLDTLARTALGLEGNRR